MSMALLLLLVLPGKGCGLQSVMRVHLMPCQAHWMVVLPWCGVHTWLQLLQASCLGSLAEHI
jgi:hypothetical protein